MIAFNFNPYFACKVGIFCVYIVYSVLVLGQISARCSMIEYVIRAVFVYYAVKLEICLDFLFSAFYSKNMGV